MAPEPSPPTESLEETLRLKLHELFLTILPENQVHFQPPENVQLTYPCIVYERDADNAQHADNRPYKLNRRYQITVMDPKPFGFTASKVRELPSSSFVRHFTRDKLHHDVYTVFI